MTSASVGIEDARRHAEDTVRRSGTSFGAGMAILPKKRREAMYAIYAFCREVDDIADDDGLTRE
ncbi:MAG: squalene/phytoene synthase family protein, partial [Parvularculaceae bacterium]|nr:squalene/phytoene synthase family protein [Parvularculaceae bacterium]